MIPVIIPVYGKPDQVDRCIERLKAQTLPVEIFIRDNNVDNIYFTAAVNEGLMRFMQADCKYMIILNQDMYLAPDAVEAMVRFMDQHPQVGIGAPLEHVPSQKDGQVLAGGLDAFPLGRHIVMNRSDVTNDRQIHWANGSCMILRKDMVLRIGLMDENYKLICSDSDYCFTARSRGWQVWIITAAYGVHEHGVSAGSNSPQLELIKLNDILYFAAKWLTGDLYRHLAYEGHRLGPQSVQALVAKYEQTRRSVLAGIKAASVQAASTGH